MYICGYIGRPECGPTVRSDPESLELYSEAYGTFKVLVTGPITLLVVSATGLTEVSPIISGVTSPAASSY